MAKMSLLVTGASGFIGSALLKRFQDDGEDVLGSVRNGEKSGQVVVGDMHAATDWREALAGRLVVVHTLAHVHQNTGRALERPSAYHRVNTLGTLNLARQAAEAGVRRFIFLSSVKVMGERGHFRANDRCHPQDAYGISKYEAELGLQSISYETGMEFVILRLPLVYGPGVQGNFLRLINLVKMGIPLPLGRIHNARSLLGLRNLVDVVASCVKHPAAAGRTFLPSDGRCVSTPELIRLMSDALGKKARLVPLPVAVITAAANLLGGRAELEKLLCSLTVDSEPLGRELGWFPVYSLQEELVATVAMWRQSRFVK